MKRLKFIIIVLAVLLFNSCEKFIDLQPLDKISTISYWKSSSDLKNYTLQFYQVFMTNTEMVSQAAVNSDDFISGSPSVIMDGERVKSTGNWRGDWANIRSINIFFDNYRKCTDVPSLFSQYVGEAYFFKAWFYYALVQKYGDVPWFSHTIDLNDAEDLTRARDPRTLVVDSILTCLDNAAKYLGTRASQGNNQITKEAAFAFKSRVALFEGTWQKYHSTDPFGTPGANSTKYFQACVNAADSLMSGRYTAGIYSTGNPSQDYYSLFGFDNMNNINEVILYRAFNATDGAGNYVQNYLTGEVNGKGATWDLVSSYLAKNGQPYDYLTLAATKKGGDFLTQIASDCDPRLSATIFIPGDLVSKALNLYFTKPPIDKGGNYLCPTGFQVKKTTNPNSANAGMTYGTPGNTGYIILRYAEVLLNYAEAQYELDHTVAYTQLNLLRSRVGMPDFTVNPQASDFNPVNYGYTITDELYEIRRERRVELALEGLRDEDYMRWAAAAIFTGTRPKGYPYNAAEFPAFTPSLDANGLIDYYQTTLPTGYKFRAGTDYLYSIPIDELTLNTNLVQNPGW
jgi:hypothetical protein